MIDGRQEENSKDEFHGIAPTFLVVNLVHVKNHPTKLDNTPDSVNF